MQTPCFDGKGRAVPFSDIIKIDYLNEVRARLMASPAIARGSGGALRGPSAINPATAVPGRTLQLV